jgi:hypothetical protein
MQDGRKLLVAEQSVPGTRVNRSFVGDEPLLPLLASDCLHGALRQSFLLQLDIVVEKVSSFHQGALKSLDSGTSRVS